MQIIGEGNGSDFELFCGCVREHDFYGLDYFALINEKFWAG